VRRLSKRVVTVFPLDTRSSNTVSLCGNPQTSCRFHNTTCRKHGAATGNRRRRREEGGEEEEEEKLTARVRLSIIRDVRTQQTCDTKGVCARASASVVVVSLFSGDDQPPRGSYTRVCTCIYTTITLCAAPHTHTHARARARSTVVVVVVVVDFGDESIRAPPTRTTLTARSAYAAARAPSSLFPRPRCLIRNNALDNLPTGPGTRKSDVWDRVRSARIISPLVVVFFLFLYGVYSFLRIVLSIVFRSDFLRPAPPPIVSKRNINYYVVVVLYIRIIETRKNLLNAIVIHCLFLEQTKKPLRI